MDDFFAGINENELSALSLEISDYARKVSGILNKIDNAMSGLQNCYRGPSADAIMQRYGEIKTSFPTVKNNISSYSDDLVALIRKMRAGDKRLTGMFDLFTEDLRVQNRKDFKL